MTPFYTLLSSLFLSPSTFQASSSSDSSRRFCTASSSWLFSIIISVLLRSSSASIAFFLHSGTERMTHSLKQIHVFQLPFFLLKSCFIRYFKVVSVYIMCVNSLLYGLISVPQRLLQNSTVFSSFSRFELLNKQDREAGYASSQLLLVSAFNLTDFTLSYLSFNRIPI